MILKNYQSIGGIHPETACLKNMLAYYGINNPNTGEPFTEAMLLGIGGGLGFSYMLWEMERHSYPSIVLAFRNNTNYAVKYLQNLCTRLGTKTKIFETGGKKKAADQLQMTLSDHDPAMVWLDLGGAPYYMHYLQVGVAVVYGLDNDHVWLDNLARKPFVIESELMVEARDKVPSFKNRIMSIKPGDPINMENALMAGLNSCVDYLGSSSASFALPALRKWSRLILDQKNKKGWPTVFKDGIGLYGTLRTVYEAIVHIGSDGGGLRGLYADFLNEAAGLPGYERLNEPASTYRALHGRWAALAQATLDDHVPEFKSTKDMLDQRADLLLAHGSQGLQEIMSINDALHALKRDLNNTFPMDETATQQFLAGLQLRLQELYTAEKEALTTLKQVILEIEKK